MAARSMSSARSQPAHRTASASAARATSAPSRAIAWRSARFLPPQASGSFSSTARWVRAARGRTPRSRDEQVRRLGGDDRGPDPAGPDLRRLRVQVQPAVEGSLRQDRPTDVALREDKRFKAPYAPDVAFDDGARKFVGREKFESYAYVRENVANARCAVESMRMEGLDRAIIRWRLGRRRPRRAVDVFVTTTLTMNLITGRAVRCEEEQWDASESDAAAASFLSSSRAAYATPMNVKAPRPTDDGEIF